MFAALDLTLVGMLEGGADGDDMVMIKGLNLEKKKEKNKKAQGKGIKCRSYFVLSDQDT